MSSPPNDRPLPSPRVLFLLAEGDDPLMIVYAVERIREIGAAPVVISPESGSLLLTITHSRTSAEWDRREAAGESLNMANLMVSVTRTVDELSADDIRSGEVLGIWLGGGFSVGRLAVDARVRKAVRAAVEAGRPVLAVGSGVKLLARSGAIVGRAVAVTPESQFDVAVCGVETVEASVVLDGTIVTATADARPSEAVGPWIARVTEALASQTSASQTSASQTAASDALPAHAGLAATSARGPNQVSAAPTPPATCPLTTGLDRLRGSETLADHPLVIRDHWDRWRTTFTTRFLESELKSEANTKSETRAAGLGGRAVLGQKVADATDFCDAALDAILQEALPVRGLHNARTWERAVTLAAVMARNGLRPEAAVLSAVAGRDDLLTVALNLAGRVWTTAAPSGSAGRPPLPDVGSDRQARETLLSGLSGPVDRTRLAGFGLDPGRLDLPSGTIDVAWSVGLVGRQANEAAIVAHLRELRRVLAPEGFAVVTVTLALSEIPVESSGRMALTFDQWERVLRAAGLQAEPDFDGRVADVQGNDPQPSPDHWTAWPEDNLTETEDLIESRVGVVCAPAMFVVRAAENSPEPMKRRDLETTTARLATRQNNVTYSQRGYWLRLNPCAAFAHGLAPRSRTHRASVTSEVAVTAQERLMATKPLWLSDLAAEVQVSVILPGPPEAATITLAVRRYRRGTSGPGEIVTSASRTVAARPATSVTHPSPQYPTVQQRTSPAVGFSVITPGETAGVMAQLTWKAEPEFVYAIEATTADARVDFHSAEVQLRLS